MDAPKKKKTTAPHLATLKRADQSRPDNSSGYAQTFAMAMQAASFSTNFNTQSDTPRRVIDKHEDEVSSPMAQGSRLKSPATYTQFSAIGPERIASYINSAQASETNALRVVKGPPAAQRHHRSLYSILDGPGGQFRLLEILPADQARDPLKLRLHVCDIEDNFETYEALSYTWSLQNGDRCDLHTTIEDCVVECDGVQIPVGKNLYLALQRLRRRDRSRIVWADAVCINQGDLAERSQQVSLMGTIFQNASQVIVWLGLDERNSPERAPVAEKAFEGVCSVVSAWARSTGTILHDEPRFALQGVDHGTSPTRRVTALESDAWFDVLELYRARWFLRVWVVQEIALARRATAIWGECEIPWEWIGLAAAIIRTNWSHIVPKLSRDTSKVNSYPHDSGPSSATHSRRQVPPGVMNAYFMYRISRLQGFFQPLCFSFCDLLALTRQFQCQDRRDNIYGLLGLPTMDEVRLSIKPDYAKSIDDVRRDVTSAMILGNAASLAFLSFVHRGVESTISNPAVPSWVPRWAAANGPRALVPLDSHPGFAAGLGQPADFYLVNSETLAVRGLIIPNEAVMGTNSPGGYTVTRKQTLSETLEHVCYSGRDLEQLAMTLVAGKGWYGTPVESREKALADFADALLHGRLLWALDLGAFGTQHVPNDYIAEPGSKRTKPAPGSSVPTKKRHDHGGPEEDNPARDFVLTVEHLEGLAKGGNGNLAVDAMVAACAGRLLFTTSTGKRGVGPASMCPGDQVCIIYGTPTPFIIRKCGAGPERGLNYMLVGECYIDGFMRGEALNMGTVSDGVWIHLV
ncbi:heterokaryon incompatibility protein-domain-containing protein [Cladorrhinum samala]|uniref:Heterokaryon incompatibility protein-domain-containing protein n=1 Tax=Cladorrhinum samala TaxID=585594 RepID=A0AAV9HVV6_9PEZI|nr:heterokaryon incompatibility protein-domain-containing protein [Cladorrhinum samala]